MLLASYTAWRLGQSKATPPLPVSSQTDAAAVGTSAAVVTIPGHLPSPIEQQAGLVMPEYPPLSGMA